MKSQVLHTVRCIITGKAAGEILKLITLGSERVKILRQLQGNECKNLPWSQRFSNVAARISPRGGLSRKPLGPG